MKSVGFSSIFWFVTSWEGEWREGKEERKGGEGRGGDQQVSVCQNVSLYLPLMTVSETDTSVSLVDAMLFIFLFLTKINTLEYSIAS